MEFAIKDVEYAFKQLEFAIRLLNYCEMNLINMDQFDTDTTVILEENISFTSGYFSMQENITLHSRFLVGTCFGTSAIALNEAFEVAGIKPNKKSEKKDDIIRTIVFMVRCAFAHGMTNPKWHASDKGYCKAYYIDFGDSTLSLSLGDLNKKEFDYKHIGGLANWYRLKDASLEILRR